MSTAPTSADESLDPREFVNSRLFNAPREESSAPLPTLRSSRRWGPNGCTNTFHQFDLRPGGMWRLTMRDAAGVEYPNAIEFLEVTTPERIVILHLKPVHRFQLSMSYSDEAGQTRLTWRLLFESADEAERVRKFIPGANEQNFDRLAQQLATMS